MSKWIEDEDVTPLDEDQMVRGEFIGTERDEKYDRGIHKIRTEGGRVVKLSGCTVLDRYFSTKKIGDMIGVKRTSDRPSKNASPYRNYKFYRLEEDNESETSSES